MAVSLAPGKLHGYHTNSHTAIRLYNSLSCWWGSDLFIEPHLKAGIKGTPLPHILSPTIFKLNTCTNAQHLD